MTFLNILFANHSQPHLTYSNRSSSLSSLFLHTVVRIQIFLQESRWIVHSLLSLYILALSSITYNILPKHTLLNKHYHCLQDYWNYNTYPRSLHRQNTAGLSRPWLRSQIWLLGKIYLGPLRFILCNAFWLRRVKRVQYIRRIRISTFLVFQKVSQQFCATSYVSKRTMTMFYD